MNLNNQFFDVIVAKEYETRQNGVAQKKTAWNKVGRAWAAKSAEAMNFELYLFPNQRYVIQFRDRSQATQTESTENGGGVANA
mgnify:CR=1 FL=1